MASRGDFGLPEAATPGNVPDMSRVRVYVSLSAEEREKLRELASRWSRNEANTALVLLREAMAKHCEPAPRPEKAEMG